MANTLRFKRGLVATIPTALAGEPLFTTDTFDLYIGNGTTNTRFQKYIASGATTQILRGDGSLYTFPLAISSPTTGQVLKYNGTSWVNDSDSGITGSGSAGQVAYFTGATTQGGSNNLFWDATNNRLGVGTNAPTVRLQVGVTSALSTALFTNTGADGGIDVHNTGTLANVRSAQLRLVNGTTFLGANDRTYQLVNYGRTSTVADFYVQYWDGTTYFDRFRVFGSTGNFGIGTGATDSGQRLQVIGDAYIKGSGATSGSTALLVQNSASTNIFQVRNDGEIFASIYNSSSFYFNNRTYNATSGSGTGYYGFNNFNPTSGTSVWNSILLQPTVNQIGGANGISRGLYVQPTLTAAADWRSIEWSNNSGWGLYGAGTANNYMAGSLGIGSTSLTGYNLRVSKAITQVSSGTGYGIVLDSTIDSTVTTSAQYFRTSETTTVSVNYTDIVHYVAAVTSQLGNVTNRYGFNASSSLGVGAGTNTFGFYGNIAAGTGRWNFYANGSAANYFAGVTQIGAGALTSEQLQVNGTMKVTGASTMNIATFTGVSGQRLITAIGADTNGNADVEIRSTGSTGASRLYFGDTAALSGSIIYNHASDAMLFSTAATTRATLDTSGNLGLGVTPSGSVKLEVNGAARLGTANATTGATTLEQAYSGDNILGVISAYQGSGAMILGYGIKAKPSADAFISTFDNFTGRRAALSINQGYFEFFNTSAVNTAKGSDVSVISQMRLHTSGNLVLGGTTSTDTTERLQVNGTAKITGNTVFNSNVGIGTSPSYRFHVLAAGTDIAAFSNTTGNSLILLTNSQTTADLIYRFRQNNGGGNFFDLRYYGTSNYFGIDYGGTSALIIDANRNIGIANSPTAGLDIKASTTSTASLRIRSGSAPTAPNDGDIWFDGTDIKMRIGGVTKTFTLV